MTRFTDRSVVALLFGCSPAAILRGVTLVVVSAVKSSTRWTPTHIGQKSTEIVPPFADGDAPSSVVFPVAGVRIRATQSHRAPCRVLSAAAAFYCVTVLCNDVSIQASARRGIAAQQTRCLDDSLFAAGTATAPKHSTTGAAAICYFDNCQSSEDLSCQVCPPSTTSTTNHFAGTDVVVSEHLLVSASARTEQEMLTLAILGAPNGSEHSQGTTGASDKRVFGYRVCSHKDCSPRADLVVRGWSLLKQLPTPIIQVAVRS